MLDQILWCFLDEAAKKAKNVEDKFQDLEAEMARLRQEHKDALQKAGTEIKGLEAAITNLEDEITELENTVKTNIQIIDYNKVMTATANARADAAEAAARDAQAAVDAAEAAATGENEEDLSVTSKRSSGGSRTYEYDDQLKEGEEDVEGLSVTSEISSDGSRSYESSVGGYDIDEEEEEDVEDLSVTSESSSGWRVREGKAAEKELKEKFAEERSMREKAEKKVKELEKKLEDARDPASILNDLVRKKPGTVVVSPRGMNLSGLSNGANRGRGH